MDVQKILIADESEENRRTLKTVLENKYMIFEAEDGQQAVQILKEHKDISLLMLDLNMPQMSGFDVLDYLRTYQMLGELPVVVVTGSTELEEELEAFQHGASEIVRRPFVPEVIRRRIENLIELYNSRRELRRELNRVKRFDSLTGLLNRQTFLAHCQRILDNTKKKERQNYTVIYTNICNFKLYNVENGSEQGDQVLLDLAAKLCSIDQNLVSSRFGQDHFVILSRNSEERIQAASQAAWEQFQQEYGHTGMELKMGSCHVSSKEDGIQAACEYAKIACDSIRNSPAYYCAYDQEMDHQISIRSYVIQHLDEALKNHHIQVYYQPVVRTMNGKICGMEGLARWISPEMGFLSPGDFIPTLEDSRLIKKLDLYVLREVCKGLNEISDMGKPIVPISINLSRVDFQEGLFEEVDHIVLENGISRDMINIEITETAFMKDPEKIYAEIQKFRDGGYQVWMDDFGSGYSSLNVLQEYTFDEIKLDMKFMSTFDEKTKNIVTSIISMAKRIGVQTLAEGVETGEQFLFLKEIGCEKVQGFWISKPLSTEAIVDHPYLQYGNMELRGWTPYYQRVSSVNTITDRPLALIEWDKEELRYLFVNKEYENELLSTGVPSLQAAYENMNLSTSSLSKVFREFISTCNMGGGERSLVYSVRDCFIRVSAICVAEHKGFKTFQVGIVNLTGMETEKQREKMDRIGRRMFGFFDTVLETDLTSGVVEILQKGDYNREIRALSGDKFESIGEAQEAFEQLVHPNELENFREFTNTATLKERLEQEKRPYLTNFFRTKIHNGAYVWKTHTLQYLAETNKVIYASRYVPILEEDVIRKVAPEYYTETSALGSSIGNWIKQGIINSSTINMFWKDTERRFVGANSSFLRTYGFRDVSEIIGKTDEDMGWHIDNAPFAEDERRVLEQGAVMANRQGTCIIQGVVRNIIATKEPIYEKGKIVGMVGYFQDVEALTENSSHIQSVGVRDNVTGLMSPRGMVNVLAGYLEEWQLYQQNFAIVRIVIPAYKQSVLTYGEEIAREMISDMGQMIAEEAGHIASCARLYGGKFIVLMKCRGREIPERFVENLRKRFLNVHKLAGNHVTINPQMDIVYAEEKDSLNSLVEYIVEGTLADRMTSHTMHSEQKELEEWIRENQEFDEERKKSITEMYEEYLNYTQVLQIQEFRSHAWSERLPVVLGFQMNLLHSLTNLYLSIHIVNIKSGSFMRLVCQEYISEVLKSITDAQEAFDEVTRVLVKPEFRQGMKEFLDLSTLSDRIGEESVISFDYDGTHMGWCRGFFIPVSRNADGSVREVLFLTQYIDDEKKREEKLKELLEFKLADIWNTYENLEELFYAADMDTFDLIYMNRKARETCGKSSWDEVRGYKCYELIQGKDAPCEFCTNRYLTEGKPMEYDYYNANHGTTMHVRDQKIVHNQRNIRIEHAVEIPSGGTKNID
ncbi:MAG: EAL domain-containing protein [Eubacteriales bacterium]|nr:EAL domain-containing protein [Eubacteriales bacterium]